MNVLMRVCVCVGMCALKAILCFAYFIRALKTPWHNILWHSLDQTQTTYHKNAHCFFALKTVMFRKIVHCVDILMCVCVCVPTCACVRINVWRSLFIHNEWNFNEIP